MATPLVLAGRNLTVTPALRQLVTRRLRRLQRIMNDSLVSSYVVLSLKKFHHRTEVTVHARGDHVLHGVGDEETWQSSVKAAVEKIEQQATTVKGKWAERKRRSTHLKAERRATPAKGGEGGASPASRTPPTVRREADVHQGRGGQGGRWERPVPGVPECQHRLHQYRLPALGWARGTDRPGRVSPAARPHR